MKKRTRILLAVILAAVFLAGWGIAEVEFLDDKKLIDLSKAIEYARPGGELTENTSDVSESGESTDVLTENETEPETEAEETEAETVIEETIPEPTEPEEKVAVISVRDETIRYDGKAIDDIDALEEAVRRDDAEYGEYVQFVVIDDFAEAHVYKRVLKKMAALEAEMGFIYSVE